MSEILVNKADWKKLFEKADFFNSYRHFLVIDISVRDMKNFEIWLVSIPFFNMCIIYFILNK